MQIEKYSFNKTYYISVKSGILWYLSHKFDWLVFSFLFFFFPQVRFSIRVLFYFRKQGTVSNWLLSTCGSFCSFVWFQLYSWAFSRLGKITWGFFCLNEKNAWPMALGRVSDIRNFSVHTSVLLSTGFERLIIVWVLLVSPHRELSVS